MRLAVWWRYFVRIKRPFYEKAVSKLTLATDLKVHYLHNLNFSSYISTNASKTWKLLNSTPRNFSQNESRDILYKIYVRPIVENYSFLFSSLRLSDILLMEEIQRDFTRKILKTDSLIDYRPRCRKLRLQPLWKRRLWLQASQKSCLLH